MSEREILIKRRDMEKPGNRELGMKETEGVTRIAVLGRGRIARGIEGSAGRGTLGNVDVKFYPQGKRNFDIADYEAAEALIEAAKRSGVDVIINAIGNNAVDTIERSESHALYRTNVLGAENVAKACKRNGFKLVQLSSEYAFAGDTAEPHRYQETDTPASGDDNPTWYGATKAMAEMRVQDTLKEDVTIARLCQNQGADSGILFFTYKNLGEAKDGNKKFKRVTDQSISITADENTARALANIARAHNGGIYHVSPEDTTTPYEISVQVAESLGLGELAGKYMEPATIEELVASGEQKVRRPKHAILGSDRYNNEFGNGETGTTQGQLDTYRRLYEKKLRAQLNI